MTKEKISENIARMRYIESQLGTIQQQLVDFNRALMEIGNTMYALESVKKLKKDSASLMSLGAGIFAEGILKKQDKVSVDIGAGTVVEKTIAEAEEFLRAREEEVKNNLTTLQNTAANMEKQYLDLGKEVQELRK